MIFPNTIKLVTMDARFSKSVSNKVLKTTVKKRAQPIKSKKNKMTNEPHPTGNKRKKQPNNEKSSVKMKAQRIVMNKAKSMNSLDKKILSPKVKSSTSETQKKRRKSNLLLAALRSGEAAEIKRLLKSSKPGAVEFSAQEQTTAKDLCLKFDDPCLVKNFLEKTNLNSGKAELFIRALRTDKMNIIKYFMKDPDIDINCLKPRFGRSALFYTRSPDVAEILIEGGADVNRPDQRGESVLMEAVKSRSVKFIKLLIRHGADVNYGKNEGKTTPLAKAAELRKVQALYAMSEHVSDVRDLPPEAACFSLPPFLACSRVEAFLSALKKNDFDTLRELMEEEGEGEEELLDVNSLVPQHGRSALFYTSSVDMVNFLVQEGGVDANRPDVNGDTVLMTALSTGATDAFIACLLENGADVNQGEKEGETTPLLKAVVSCSMKIISLLIDYGANMHYATPDGRTPLLLSRSVTMTDLFLTKCIDLRAVANAFKLTPLMLYLHLGKPRCSKNQFIHFLAAGQNVNEKSAEGKTILTYAAELNNREMLSWCVNYGADVNIPDSTGETALTILCKNPEVFYFKTPNSREWGFKYMYDPDAGDLRDAQINNASPGGSWYLQSRNLTYDMIKLLISRGGSTPYSPFLNVALSDFINRNDLAVVRAILTNGAAPAVYKNFIIDADYRCGIAKYASPLYVAAMRMNYRLMKLFVKSGFLTRFDLWVLRSNPTLMQAMDCFYTRFRNGRGCGPSVYFKMLLLSRPLSLFQLSFVVASDALGPGGDREKRVRGSGLPFLIQEKLLFRDLARLAPKYLKKV